MLVVLEGVDGTGKTSVFNALKDTVDEAFVFPGPFKDGIINLQKDINKLQGLRLKRQIAYTQLCMLFVADQLAQEEEIRLIPTEEIVLCDRFWLSNLAYQKDNILPSAYLTLETVAREVFLLPDLIIYLKINESARGSRLAARTITSDVLMPNNLEQIKFNYTKILSQCADRGSKIVEIDTSHKMVSEICDEIVKYFK